MKNERIKIAEGKKVSLVVPEKSDIELWYKWINNPKVNQFLKNGRKTYSLEFEEKYYEEMSIAENNIKFSIYLNKEKEVIGAIDLSSISHYDGIASFGVMIGEISHHNKGYGTEAIKLFLDYAFNIQNLRKIYGSYIASNDKGGHVYKKIGFKEIGKYKKQLYKNGGYHDQVLIEIFKEDFYKLNKEFVK